MSRWSQQNATLTATTFGNFAQFGSRVVISPFLIAVAETFIVTKSTIGLVLTLLWGVFALLQFPSGVLADRFGERRIIIVSLSATTIGSLVLAFSPSFPLFVVAAVILGAGAGLYFAAGSSLVSKRFESDKGRSLAIHSAGAPLAGLVLPVGATAIAAWTSWRVGIAISAVVALLALVAILLTIDAEPAPNPSMDVWRAFHPRSAYHLLSRPEVAFTTLIATCGMYAFQSLLSFLPTFLREYHQFSEATASILFSVMFVLMAVGLPVAGRFGDQYGVHVGIAYPMVIAAVSLVGVLFSPARLVTYIGIAGIGIGITWAGAVQSQFMQTLSVDERGSGFGLARTVFVFLGASGNVVTGYLAEHFGWATAYGVVVCLLGIAAILVLVNRFQNTDEYPFFSR